MGEAETGCDTGIRERVIMIIYLHDCRTQMPFHYAEHYRTNRTKKYYLPQRADIPNVGQEIGGKMDKCQGEVVRVGKQQ